MSGLSGGGKTAAAKLFEDLGYAVVDNLPSELLPDLAELVSSDPSRHARIAIVLDVRSGDAPLAFARMRGALEGRGIRPQVFFLEARDEILIRRYSETRHRHPLGDQRGIASSIAEERRLLETVRADADVVLDTSDMSLRELRETIFSHLEDHVEEDQLVIQLISFGYKFGVPLEADLVFDVRFMQNPYYVPELRQSSGLTEAVRTFVLDQPVARRFVAFLHDFLDFTLPAYESEGKTRLTIAIGCTGGYHRSIVIAEELARLARRARRPGLGLPSRARPVVNLRRWLQVGMGFKRWLLVVFIGELCLALGGRLRPAPALPRHRRVRAAPGGHLLADPPAAPATSPGRSSSGCSGSALFVLGSVKAIRAIMEPLRSPDADQPLVEVIYQKRFLARGPRIVAIGGGTGLSMLLRGLKEHTSNLTAVVTVADDGGSSGKLREQFGVPAVGDIRNCIVALADAEPLMSELLQYRFPEAEGTGQRDDSSSLAGHAVGNLLIAALTAVEGGDFEEGVRQMNRVLAVRGQVLPVSPTPVVLHARAARRPDDRGPVADRPGVGHRAGLAGARRRRRVRGRRPRDRGGRRDRARPGQPLHEHPAEPAHAPHPGRRPRLERGADLRLQRRGPGRRDGGLRPGRPSRGHGRPHRARPGRRRAGQQPRRERRAPTGRTATP